jgi:hypothetical protein
MICRHPEHARFKATGAEWCSQCGSFRFRYWFRWLPGLSIPEQEWIASTLELVLLDAHEQKVKKAKGESSASKAP